MSSDQESSPAKASKKRRARRFGVALAAVGFAAEAIAVARQGYGLGGRIVVRCRQGHLFSTIWIPGVSLKALRLGWLRFQRCPVANHWSLVAPVNESSLSEEERRAARERIDLRIP